MTEESDRNRACGTLANTDGCRTRKRRCDQKQPYCSNCVRSVVRDQQGLPVCVYSIRRKTARPGSADHLRLLLAQAPAQDGPPLVVNPPSIIHRDFDLGNNDFELQLSASPREDFHEYTYPPIDRPLVISTLPYARQAFSNDHEQLEVNLVRLGHLQSMMRLSVGDINVIYSVVPDMDKLPRAVLFALCAYGVLYSQHEGVFTPGISANRSSVRVQKCRVLIARSEDGVSAGIMRINSAESVVVKEVCDHITAILILARLHYGLGDVHNCASCLRTL